MNNTICVACGLILWFSCGTSLSWAEDQPIYRDPGAPLEARVEDALSRMTLDEKLGQMRGAWLKNVDDALVAAVDDHIGFVVFNEMRRQPAVAAEAAARFLREFREKSRLKIDPVIVSAGAHGLQSEHGTEFPGGIGLAATWNTNLMARIGRILGAEHRSRGFNLMVAPRLYLTVDPRIGRVEEGYGEDPFLVAQMTTPYVQGLQAEGVISVICLYPTEFGPGGRLCETLEISERDLRERYLLPFEYAVKIGGAAGIMPAYGAVNGLPVHGSTWLLDTILRKEWGFDGIVFNDYNANASFSGRLGVPDPTTRFVKARMNVEFPFLGAYDDDLEVALADGRVTEAEIDRLVRDILRVKVRFGLLDPEYPVPEPADAVAIAGSEETRALAREASREGIVLLANRGNTLPFGETIRKLAVMGPMAAPPSPLLLGAYSGGPSGLVNIADGLVRSGRAEVNVVSYPRRPDPRRPVPPANLFRDASATVSGLRASIFAGNEALGNPVAVMDVPDVELTWSNVVPASLKGQAFTVCIDGYLQYPPDIITECLFSSRTSKGALSLRVGGLNVINAKAGDRIDGKIKLEAGHVYPFELVVTPVTGERAFTLEWQFVEEYHANHFVMTPAEMDACVTAARDADAAVVCVGIVEGEAKDRTNLRLPGNQQELIKRVKATGKPVVVVLVAGNVVELLDWYQEVDAILTVWHPGMEGGNALADILFGDVSPSGRLPLSFVKTVGQLPMTYNRYPTARPGFYVDSDTEALFPFGYGLTYTTFAYSNLVVTPDEIGQGDMLEVSFELENTGGREGTEVPQLYTRSWNTSVVRPILELRAFERVTLHPGEKRAVTFRVPSEQLMYHGVDYATGRITERILEPHELHIKVGSSSRQLHLQHKINVRYRL